MSGLPFCVVLPVFDKFEQTEIGLVVTKISSFKPYRKKFPDGTYEIDSSRSTIFMDDKDTYHFCTLSVREVADLINNVVDGVEE